MHVYLSYEYRKKIKKNGYQVNEDAFGEIGQRAEMRVIINNSVPTWSK